MTSWSRIPFSWITLGTLVCLSGCGAANQPGQPSNRPLRVGVNQSPPYCLIGTDGKPTGFSVDVIREAARRKGVRLQLIVFKEGPDAPLATGRADVWPLVTDIPERRGRIFFSEPWMRTTYALLVPHGSPVTDVPSARGRRISHGNYALNGRLARRIFPQSVLVPDPPGADLNALCTGGADAAMIETKEMMARTLQRSAPCRYMDFDLIPLTGVTYDMAIGASAAGRRQAQVLRAAINDMAQDSTLDRIYRKWLRDPGDETAVVAELIGVRRRNMLLLWTTCLLTAALGLLLGMVLRQRAARRAIQAATDFASAALNTTGGLVLITDRQGGIVRFNRACELVTRMTANQVAGKIVWDLFVPPDDIPSVKSLYACLAGGLKHSGNEYHWRTPEGDRLYSWSHSVLLDSAGRVEYIVNTGIDISHREASEKQLMQEAMRDPLTNLLNRRGLKRELDSAIARARSGEPLRFGLVDLDRFKGINDTFGHSAGDEVLICFAGLLREALGPGGVSARFGGDEFCFLLTGLNTAFSLAQLRQKWCEQEFRASGGRAFRVGASFGMATWNESMRDASDLFEAADQVLYEAKSLLPARTLAAT